MIKYMGLILLLLASLFFYNDLDLPILPPNDPRREVVKAPAELPSPPPSSPVILIEEPAPPIFFSEEIPATESIVYVLDFSQSMSGIFERVDYRTTRNRWQIAQIEAIKSINGLAESFRFNIVIFGTNRGCGVAAWQRDLQQATEPTKAAAAEWISSFTDVIYYGGATPTAPGVIVGLEMKPESIVLLTDGYPSACGLDPGVVPWVSHRKRILAANTDGIPIQVFGIGLEMSYAREFCLGVAGDSGGTFVEITRK